MIIDGFMFYNEVDLLKLRLEELYPVVDKFVLVQAWHTFRGQNKELTFHPSDPQWAPWIDKIETVNVGLSGGTGPWEREAYQRNMIGTAALAICESDDDLVILSDCDEIPSRETVEHTIKQFGLYDVQIHTPMFYYALNCRTPQKWEAIKVVKAERLSRESVQSVRFAKMNATIINGGWHFSYLGDADTIRNKIKAFSHSELDLPEIHAGIEVAMEWKTDPFGWGQKFEIDRGPQKLPHAVKNDPEYWSKYLW